MKKFTYPHLIHIVLQLILVMEAELAYGILEDITSRWLFAGLRKTLAYSRQSDCDARRGFDFVILFAHILPVTLLATQLKANYPSQITNI
jgi:hypothetical protein